MWRTISLTCGRCGWSMARDEHSNPPVQPSTVLLEVLFQRFSPILMTINLDWSWKSYHHYFHCFHHCPLQHWKLIECLFYFRMFAASYVLCMYLGGAWPITGDDNTNKITLYSFFLSYCLLCIDSPHFTTFNLFWISFFCFTDCLVCTSQQCCWVLFGFVHKN